MQNSAESTAVSPFRVFWQPGCSSCVKVKEFMTELGLPFESVNVLADEKGFEDLRALGAQSVPVVSRGNTFVFAQSLDDVAKFVGKKVDLRRLAPPELMKRWLYILDTARSETAELPVQHLEFRPVIKRTRTLRDLAYHVFQVPDAFLLAIVDGKPDMLPIHVDAPADVKNVADVLAYADSVTHRLRAWWDGLVDKDCNWQVDTYYGVQPGTTFLERCTWHSAQHARQLLWVCDHLDIKVTNRIDSKVYDGLPMPVTIWE